MNTNEQRLAEINASLARINEGLDEIDEAVAEAQSANIPFRDKNPISEAIRERQKFRSNTMRGNEVADGYLPSTGQMPDEWAILFRAEKPSYIVISFQTPIAWWSERLGWTIPDVKYSATTTRHQNAVRDALSGEKARS